MIEIKRLEILGNMVILNEYTILNIQYTEPEHGYYCVVHGEHVSNERFFMGLFNINDPKIAHICPECYRKLRILAESKS